MSNQQGDMAELTDNPEARGEPSIFDTLSSGSLDDFADCFVNGLKEVYEYDATEVKEFLTTFNSPHEPAKFVALTTLRQALLEKLFNKFPSLSTRQLYNRRKTETMAYDIYIRGFCCVNELEDARLNKILKNNEVNNADINDVLDTSQATTGDLNAELLETCLNLNRTVLDLTKMVKNLQDDVKFLSGKLRASKFQQDVAARVQPAPVQPAPGATVSTEASVVSQTSQADGDVTPKEVVNENREDGGSSSSGGNSTVDQLQNGNAQFTLQHDQRLKALSGKAFPGSNRNEISGTATRPMSIESVSAKTQSTSLKTPKSVYVGRLSAKTSVESLRNHLNSEGISRISDIIDLKTRAPDQTSFCIIADDSNAEEALYDASIWPRGAKIRPFKEKSDNFNQQRRNPQQWRSSRGPRYRQQNNSSPQWFRNTENSQSTQVKNGHIYGPPPAAAGSPPIPASAARPPQLMASGIQQSYAPTEFRCYISAHHIVYQGLQFDLIIHPLYYSI